MTALRGFVEVQVMSERVLLAWNVLPNLKLRTIRLRDIAEFEKARDYESIAIDRAPTEIRLTNGHGLLVNQSYPVLRDLIQEAL